MVGNNLMISILSGHTAFIILAKQKKNKKKNDSAFLSV